MKKFIIQILGILLILLVLLEVLDFAYTTVYEHSKPRTKFQYLRSLKNTKINYIFLGSSRVENGIIPSVIENKSNKSCVNLGFQAAKLGDIYTVFKLLKEYNITSDSVFIQMDYNFDTKGHSINLPYQINPFIKESKVIKDYLIDYVGEDRSNYYVPFIRYCKNEPKIGFREFFACLIGKTTTVVTNKGYGAFQGIEQQGNGHRTLPNVIASNNSFFDRIKRYSIENKIKVVYFCAPFCKHTKNLDYIKKLKTKIPELYDFSSDIQEDKLFVNCYHLNDAGAKKFTEIFVDKILKNKK